MGRSRGGNRVGRIGEGERGMETGRRGEQGGERRGTGVGRGGPKRGVSMCGVWCVAYGVELVL